MMERTEASDAIGRWVGQHEDEFVEFVSELVLAESPSTDPATQGPVFDLVSAALEAVGLETMLHPGVETGGVMTAMRPEADAAAPRQLLLGHVDTVWPVGTLETMPLRVDGGILHGPGSFDMKAGVAQMVFALRALDALGLQPEVEPVVLLNSDEEIGSAESESRIREAAQRSVRALVLEPALAPDGRIKTSRRGTGHFHIKVIGKGAHTGLAPEQGASAILELSHVIQALHALTDRDRGVEVNVGQVSGGVRPNVVAPAARAVVDVRVRTVDDARWVQDRIHALEAVTPGTRLVVEGAVDRLPMERTPRNTRLWESTRSAARELGLELEDGMSGGASDGNFTSQYTATLDGLGPVGDGAHADHEHIDVARTLERAALLARLLLLPPR
jgi:glutamate carboxypeptidase